MESSPARKKPKTEGTHAGARYRCPGCDITIESKLRMYEHIAVQHNAPTMKIPISHELGKLAFNYYQTFTKEKKAFFLDAESVILNTEQRAAWKPFRALFKYKHYPHYTDFTNVTSRNPGGRKLCESDFKDSQEFQDYSDIGGTMRQIEAGPFQAETIVHYSWSEMNEMNLKREAIRSLNEFPNKEEYVKEAEAEMVKMGHYLK